MDDTPRSSTQSGKPPCQAPPSDERLMLDFTKGETGAFDELFRRYKGPIYGFFRRRMIDGPQAEELTQETFVAVLRRVSRYRPEALFRTYLYAIALKILQAYRRKAAFRAAFLGDWKRAQDAASREKTETEMVMRQALRKLDSRDREILMLREYEQLSYAEIAELLRTPVNTVRSRLFRARLTLRELLSSESQKSPQTNLARFEEQA